MFLHTFNTWLIANLLHPLLISAFGYMIYGHDGVLWYADVVKGYFIVLAASLICSLPFLVFGWLLLRLVVSSDHTPSGRLFLWMIFSAMVVFLEVLSLIIMVKQPLDPKTFSLAIPGVLAVSAAIIIRYQQFRKLIPLPETNTNENNLV
jgi:hypothetical protein